MKLTAKEIIQIYIQIYIQDYNKRLAKHLSGLVAFPEEELLKLIKEMK